MKMKMICQRAMTSTDCILLKMRKRIEREFSPRLDLHEAGVHVEPAVVDAPVVVVLEAHVEQDDEGWHAPPNLEVTNR